jgi:hypothetical protein
LPPFLFVATAVKLAVMNPAQRHDELIANPMAERARLPKSKVVSIRRPPAADQAGLRTHKLTMRLITFPNEFQKWCRRFGSHNCNPLGETRGRTILGGQRTLRVDRVLTRLLIHLLGMRGVAQLRTGAVQRL